MGTSLARRTFYWASLALCLATCSLGCRRHPTLDEEQRTQQEHEQLLMMQRMLLGAMDRSDAETDDGGSSAGATDSAAPTHSAVRP